jgi:hypothetical protein
VLPAVPVLVTVTVTSLIGTNELQKTLALRATRTALQTATLSRGSSSARPILDAEARRKSEVKVAVVEAKEMYTIADRLDKEKTAHRRRFTCPCYMRFKLAAERGVRIIECNLHVVALWQSIWSMQGRTCIHVSSGYAVCEKHSSANAGTGEVWRDLWRPLEAWIRSGSDGVVYPAITWSLVSQDGVSL